MLEIIKDNKARPVSYPSLGVFKGPNERYHGMKVIFWSHCKQTVLDRIGIYEAGQNISGFNPNEFDLFDFKISY